MDKSVYYFVLLISTMVLAFLPSLAADLKGNSKRGKQLFQDLQCSICHLDGGNNVNPERPLKGAGFQKRYPDDKALAKIIRNGVSVKGMPGFGKDKVSDQDLADLMSFIRTLTPKAKK